MPTINFGEGEGGDFTVPNGDYILELTEATEGVSSQKKTPQAELVYEIVDGPGEAEAEGLIGSTFRDWLYETPRAVFRIRAWLEAISGRKVPGDKAVKFEYTEFIGKRVGARIITKNERYEGRTSSRSRVQEYVPMSDLESDDTEPIEPANDVVAAPAPTNEVPFEF